jgi:hypothetical protein
VLCRLEVQNNVVLCRLEVSHVYVACLQVAYQWREHFIVIFGPSCNPDADVEGAGSRPDFDFSFNVRALF